MYKALGKDPHGKEYEMKSLVQDFDKVARKFLAKVRKGKDEQLFSRKQILYRHGLRSSQRMTIDEEITTLLKGMDHDQKRLRSILSTLKEKQGNDPENSVLNARKKIDELIAECKPMF